MDTPYHPTVPTDQPTSSHTAPLSRLEPFPRQGNSVVDTTSRVTKLTAEQYGQRVHLYWRTSFASSLYSGEHFASLAEFLCPLPSKRPKSADPPENFAYFYQLHSDTSPAAIRLKWSDIDDENYALENSILFLTGYPSAEWLNKLGAYYELDPEFYQRHLDFMTPSFTPSVEVTGYSPSLMLPSSNTTIFQLTYTSVGIEDDRPYEEIAKLQNDADIKMQQYLQDLKNGENWEAKASIVRSYCVHGQNKFSIEQKLTVYFAPKRLDSKHWILIVWLDSGESLANSPKGPWSSEDGVVHRHNFHPVSMYKPGIAIKQHRVVTDQPERRSLAPLEQTVGLLPRFYGKSLNVKDVSSDPFLALDEVFAFILASKLLFLKTISSDLDIAEKSNDSRGYICRTPTLEHYQRLLDRLSHRTEETITFIENRRNLGWNSSEKSMAVEMKLKLDFEYLLREVRRLKQRCAGQILRNLEGTPAQSQKYQNVAEPTSVWNFFLITLLAIALFVKVYSERPDSKVICP